MAWPISFFTGESSNPKVDSVGSDDGTDAKGRAALAVNELLQHFQAQGAPPPSARVGDPKMKQRQSEPLRLWHLWRYGAFAAMKASDIVSAVLSHHIRGPPKKSWGIEMTILTCIMRDVSRHSHLADIATIRLLMNISGFAPVPSDALVTPVTFQVPRRNLRGILADFDALEDGKRELAGEWVVGKRTWQRLQTEWKAAQKAARGNDPHGQSAPSGQRKRKERVVLYLHGGAYYLSSPATHRLITIPLSKSLDARVFALDYRLAPETRFPGPLHDAVSAYFRLTDDLHIPPENIIIAGDSAGGGLSLALIMYLRDNGYPLPGGGILMSPWVDLTMSCDSWDTNAAYDVVPKPLPGDHLNPIACYLGEHMEKYLTHPYASPLFGDFNGLPPLLIQGGDSEVLRDEITLLAHKATLAGVNVRHELYEDAIHVFQTFPFLDQARQSFVSARAWVREVLVPLGDESSQALERNTEQKLASEIDTKAARVVQGDGSESASLKDDIVVQEIPVAAEGREEGDMDEGSSSQDDEPSWVSPAPWPTPPASSDTDDTDANTLQREPSRSSTTRSVASMSSTRSNTSSTRSRSSTTSLTSSSSFWRPLSSLSSSFTSTESSHTASLSSASGIRRVPSRGGIAHTSTSTYSHLPSRSTSSAHVPSTTHSPSSTFSHARSPSYRDLRLSSITSSTASAPRPSIRRSRSSHPDIFTLCAQWASEGPANQTTTYRPDVDVLPSSPSLSSRRRKHSNSLSAAKFSVNNS